MNRAVQCFLLLLFGGALVRIGTSDLLTRYVKESARPWVIVAGSAVVLVALGGLVLERTAHGGGPRVGWLVLAPAMVALLVVPAPLGLYVAQRVTPVQPDSGVHQSFPRLRGDGVHELMLGDVVLRVLWDDGRTLRGKQLAVTGFVMSTRPDGFVLARLVITCCAADARPMEIDVRTDQRPSPGTWVVATARFAGVEPDRTYVPVLTAESVRAVAVPDDPYD